METISIPGGGLPVAATIKWQGKEIEKQAEESLYKRLLLGCEHVRGVVQTRLSTSSRSSGRSVPGEYPHADTGRLRNSIFQDVDRKKLAGMVGTNLKYGLWLEYGTAGGKLIKASPGKVLSWVGRDGKRYFAKSVVQGPIVGRSFLRRGILEAQPKLKKLFATEWTEFRVGDAK